MQVGQRETAAVRRMQQGAGPLHCAAQPPLLALHSSACADKVSWSTGHRLWPRKTRVTPLL